MAKTGKKELLSNQSVLPAGDCEALINKLQSRFEKNIDRHKNISWTKIEAKLKANPQKLWPLFKMEETGGEPDVMGYDNKTDEYIFYDCSAESPIGRRSVCYGQEALNSRKEHKPKNSAVGMSSKMGIELLTEAPYSELQQFGKFDTKTSSWLKTPPEIRELGGAIFADFRYGNVFVYHNGAESYYSARGFRASLRT
jgi:hypothetical protein